MNSFLQMSLKKKLVLAAVAIVVVAGGIYLFRHKSEPSAPDTTGKSEQIDLSKVSTTTHVGGYTIEPVPVEDTTIPAPSYTKAIVYAATVPADVRVAIEAQFAEVKSMITANAKDINAWTRLGVIKKVAGDYAGAEEDWLYVTKVWPSDPVALGNLGDLYRTEGNTVKAKAMYDLAIQKAEASGNAGLAASYKTERDSL